jgi:hypothetical protein
MIVHRLISFLSGKMTFEFALIGDIDPQSLSRKEELDRGITDHDIGQIK